MTKASTMQPTSCSTRTGICKPCSRHCVVSAILAEPNWSCHVRLLVSADGATSTTVVTMELDKRFLNPGMLQR